MKNERKMCPCWFTFVIRECALVSKSVCVCGSGSGGGGGGREPGVYIYIGVKFQALFILTSLLKHLRSICIVSLFNLILYIIAMFVDVF